ncbi:MAG: lysophospholipid acyltransferase family protein, partial [Synergistaceae bacterium]|nr:lysophospholipid acyltransferase family protein [Synergistaceae bacterium]
MNNKQTFIWFILSTFRKIVTILPHQAAVMLGGFVGSLIPLFTRNKLKEATDRCARVLVIPHKEASRIVKGAYRNFGKSTAEFIRIPVMASKLDNIVTVYGQENLSEAYEAGKGVFVVTAHIGNWEYAGSWCAQHGYPMNGLGTDQRDGRITDLIIELRKAGGMKALGKASDLKAMIKALQAGEIIAVPVDQDAKKAGLVSPFLGYPASTPIGMAKLADKLGCAVVPAYCVRWLDTQKLELHFLPALKGRDGKPYGKDLQSSIDDCNAVISEWIRKYPDQWMWMYPRWESVER